MVDKNRSDHLLAGLLRLLGQQNSLDVGQNTTLSDRDARQQLVQFLDVAGGQIDRRSGTNLRSDILKSR